MNNIEVAAYEEALAELRKLNDSMALAIKDAESLLDLFDKPEVAPYFPDDRVRQSLRNVAYYVERMQDVYEPISCVV